MVWILALGQCKFGFLVRICSSFFISSSPRSKSYNADKFLYYFPLFFLFIPKKMSLFGEFPIHKGIFDLIPTYTGSGFVSYLHVLGHLPHHLAKTNLKLIRIGRCPWGKHTTWRGRGHWPFWHLFFHWFWPLKNFPFLFSISICIWK